MTDPAENNTPVTPRCPWCSTEVTAETVTCPNCGASLHEEAAADIPGLTQVDPGATTVRTTPRGRGLIGWLSGDYETTDTDIDKAGVEPPSSEVRQEMLRLEMDALRSELDAEAAARAIEEPDVEAVTGPEPEAPSGSAATGAQPAATGAQPAAAAQPAADAAAKEDGTDSAS